LPSLKPPIPDSKLCWLHVTANNMSWVDVGCRPSQPGRIVAINDQKQCLQKLMRDWYPTSAGLDKQSWELKQRPSVLQITNPPLHSRHMEPSCITRGNALHESKTRVPGAISDIPWAPGPSDSGLEANEKPSSTNGNSHSGDDQQPILTLYVRIDHHIMGLKYKI
jgi:hypothetical protein